MEFNKNLLSCERKTKTFRCNFERTLAIVQFNKILIMTAGEFRVFDVSMYWKYVFFRFWKGIKSKSRAWMCHRFQRSSSVFLKT